MKMINITLPGHEDATLEGYILDCELTLGQQSERPAIVICPGGGYLYCSPREAEPVALAYAARGIHAFVLRYSTGRNAKGFAPLEEVDWVIKYLRDNSAEWHIDPNKILTCGFSAGGHVALAAGVLAENRPNGMVLCYPATSMPNMPGADMMLKLLMGRNNVTDEDAAGLELISKVDKNSPPAFIVSTAEDMLHCPLQSDTAICTLAMNCTYSSTVPTDILLPPTFRQTAARRCLTNPMPSGLI